MMNHEDDKKNKRDVYLYDVPAAVKKSKELGRPLTDEELKPFIVEKLKYGLQYD